MFPVAAAVRTVVVNEPGTTQPCSPAGYVVVDPVNVENDCTYGKPCGAGSLCAFAFPASSCITHTITISTKDFTGAPGKYRNIITTVLLLQMWNCNINGPLFLCYVYNNSIWIYCKQLTVLKNVIE
jgi:hypothetical protein